MIKLSTQCSKVYACYVWKQWKIWLQNCKMDIKTMQCMWILNTNDAWKNFLVKNIETENFSIAIDQESIEHQLSQADSNQKFQSQFRLIEKQVRSIESLEKSDFWKTEHFKAETPQSTLFYKKNAWVWDEKFFKNTWIQPRSSKIKIFNQFVLKVQTLNTVCIKIKELLILDGHNKITHNIMYQV